MQQQDPGYGRYEGSPGYGQQFETPPQPQAASGAYHDEYADPIAQRVNTGQGPAGRIYPRSSATTATAGMRLALAIVSICILVPIAGIIFGILQGGALVPFLVACAAIVLINAIFNNPSLFKS